EEHTVAPRASGRVPAPVAPFVSRFPSVCFDLLSNPIYFRIWARILLREEFCLWRPSNGGNSFFSGFLCPFQDGDVPCGGYVSLVCARTVVVVISLRRLIFPSKTRLRLRGCGGHGLRFVTVMHAPVVAGETRPCSDVGSPGGGDDAGSYLEVGRITRCRW
ncbi:hypothetical protein HID58_053906, partial [Brassica napus]